MHLGTAPGPQLIRVYAYLASPHFPQARHEAVEGASTCCFTNATISAKRAMTRHWTLRARGLRRASVAIGAGVAGLCLFISVRDSPGLSATVRQFSLVTHQASGIAARHGRCPRRQRCPARPARRLRDCGAIACCSSRLPRFGLVPRPGTGMTSRPGSRRSGSGTRWWARSASVTASPDRGQPLFRTGPGEWLPRSAPDHRRLGSFRVFLSAALAFRPGSRNPERRICGQLRAGRRVVPRNAGWLRAGSG